MSTINRQGAVLANVTASATSVALFAAGAGNQGRVVFNDADQPLHIAFSATAASLTAFTVRVAAGGYFEFRLPLYNGPCTAIWGPAPTGTARTTMW